MSSELGLNSSTSHHPSPGSSSSSSADATIHGSMEAVLHCLQKHARLERRIHSNGEGQHSKIACSTFPLSGRPIGEGWRLFIQVN
jgi:hypothetical protein